MKKKESWLEEDDMQLQFILNNLRWIIPLVVVIVLGSLFGLTKGCAKISRAINKGEYGHAGEIILSLPSNYDDLRLSDDGR